MRPGYAERSRGRTLQWDWPQRREDGMAADPRVERPQRRILGRYVVADPAICHGQLTFRGTRIFVADVLEQVASGMAWEAIIEEWRGSISREAIAEAVRLASQTFLEQKEEAEPQPAGK